MTVERKSEGIQSSYRSLKTQIEEEARRKVSQESAEKAFWGTLNKNQELLPNCVVKIQEGDKSGYFLFRGIFYQDQPRYFFDSRNNLYEIATAEECLEVKLIERQLEIPEMETMIVAAEKTALNCEEDDKLIVPKGFFVFTYIFSDFEDRTIKSCTVIKTDSLRDAVKQLFSSLSSRGPTTFYHNFKVNQGKGWRSLGACDNFGLGHIVFGWYNDEHPDRRCYLYEENQITGADGQCDLIVHGEGDAFNKIIVLLTSMVLPSRYQLIYNFETAFPEYGGQPVLTTKNGSEILAVGLKEIKECFKKYLDCELDFKKSKN